MTDFHSQSICVIGLGYVGLPTAAILATYNANVIGVDVNEDIVARVNQGKIHIIEPELDALVAAAVQDGRLHATIQPKNADVFIIAVPTPTSTTMGADLSYVEQATRSIAPVLKSGDVVILESTSPIGTTEKIAEWLHQEREDLSFPLSATDKAEVYIAHCPERVMPGHAISELLSNDRVIGGITPECANKAAAVYRIFCKGNLTVTEAKVAELTKLAENAYRDVNIAFANELAQVCENTGTNVWDVITTANKHPRVNIHSPGIGVGGHCIPVDPWFIIEAAPENTKLLKTARTINDERPDIMVDKIRQAAHMGASVGAEIVEKRKKIACLGLAYKPDVDDLRNSPAVEIVKRLLDEDFADIVVAEPKVQELPKTLADYDNIEKQSTDRAIADADLIVLLVPHSSFKDINKLSLDGKTVIDGCGGWV